MTTEPIEAVVEERPSTDPDDPHAPTEIVRIYEERGDIIALAETMEKRAVAFATVIRHVLNVTFPEDWVIHRGTGSDGDTAFLQASGAERIAAFVGVGITDMELTRENREDSKGPFYQYNGKAKFSWMGRTVEATGGASCRHNRLDHGGKLTSQDVDERNVRTFAQSSLRRIGITSLLGLRDYPISELPEKTRNGRPFRERVRTVEYRKGTEGGQTATADEKKLHEDLMRWGSQMFGTDGNAASDWLEQLTEFTNKDKEKVRGVRDLKRLTGKRLEIAHAKAKEAFVKWSGAGGGAS